MLCPKCGGKLSIELVHTGGCHGHGPDEYCYCNAPDTHIEVACYAPKKRGYCNYRQKIVPGLTDDDAIARWIEERYENR